MVDYGFSWFWVDVAHEWDDRVKIIKVWCLCFGMKRVVNFGFGLVVLLGIGLVFAYVQSIPSPGHGGDKVFIVVNGDSIDLQGAIDAGYFDTSYAGWGAYSGVVNSGQLGEDIFVSLGGVNKNFQEAINDGSLCTFVPVPGSYSYSGSYPVGHNGEDVLVDFGVEKSLQKAIDDGDFYECVLVNCAGSWNLNVAPCSVSACGSSGNYDARYTVSAIAEYGGTACAVADGTFVDDGGNACSAAACAPATASTCGGFASGYFCFRGSFIGRTRPNSLSGCKAWCETLSNVGCCQYSSNNGYCKAVTGTPRDAGAGGSQYSANCA